MEDRRESSLNPGSERGVRVKPQSRKTEKLFALALCERGQGRAEQLARAAPAQAAIETPSS
jgi:hypothetical protein